MSMSLGAGETTVLRMITGYSMFANGGKRVKATLIDRIQDRWGNTIYKHDERICQGCDAPEWNNQPEPRLIDKREQVIDPLTAYQITSILEGVIQRGTGIAIKEVGKHLAGKTGTTNDAKDLWFVGYSPNLAFGVFMSANEVGGHYAVAEVKYYGPKGARGGGRGRTNMDDQEDHIRRRAYHLWEEAGRPEGRSDEFWHAARAEIADEEALEAARAIP
jgi:membrane peptidoglycan carboxypeptidase